MVKLIINHFFARLLAKNHTSIFALENTEMFGKYPTTDHLINVNAFDMLVSPLGFHVLVKLGRSISQ